MLTIKTFLCVITYCIGHVSGSLKENCAASYWYESITHNGLAPEQGLGNNWTVYRNVRDYGATGDGVHDDSLAIQSAISDGQRDKGIYGETAQPAVVYIPSGTYIIGTPLQNYVGTVIMGDPRDRPVLKASSNIDNTFLLNGADPKYNGLNGFYHEIKNIVLDSTAVAASTKFNLLRWGLSQGCQVQNVQFEMPKDSAHTGLITDINSSPLILNDLQFHGGNNGLALSATQYHLKNLYFNGTTTAINVTDLVQATGQGLRFENVKTGIDLTNGETNIFTLIDSSAIDTEIVLAAAVETGIVLENVRIEENVPITVKSGEQTALVGSVPSEQTWIKGSVFPVQATANVPVTDSGSFYNTSRPSVLLNPDGAFSTIVPPDYADVCLSNVVNVKTVSEYPVKGDGVTDDTESLQAILSANAGSGKLLYFPHGIYLISDTLQLPSGVNLIGESFTQLSAKGPNFKDPKTPRPMLQVGSIGEVGTVQLTDFVFTMAEPLPGVVLVEVNMAGKEAGDVAFFNCHFRIGGARGSSVETSCSDPASCQPARLSAHLTSGSSSYWENSWAWTADHDLDGNSTQNPGDAGGFLVEAQRGTWFLGLGLEHHVLYQMNLYHASNVFIGLQQGETAYYQGSNNTLLTPAPWSNSLISSDPTWSWCGENNATCRMGLYQRISHSSNINVYSAGFWNFVSGPERTFCATDCQDNAVQYEYNTKLFVYGLSVINNKNLILESGVNAGEDNIAIAPRDLVAGPNHDGVFNTGTIAAYFRQSG